MTHTNFLRGVLSMVTFAVVVSVCYQSGFSQALSPLSDRQVKKQIRKLVKASRKSVRKGRFAVALNEINAALELAPENQDILLRKARVLMKQKQYLDAYDIAFEVARKNSKSDEAFAILGTVALKAGRFQESYTLLDNALILNKRNALANASIGMLLFYQNRVKASMRYLNAATFYDTRNPDFVYSLAQVSSRAENYKQAAEAYDRFLQVAPYTDKDRRERIKGLIKFLNYLGTRTGLYRVAGESRAVLPTRIENNRPLVPVKLKKNGRTLNFVLDTGSAISVLSKKTAKEFGIRAVAKGGNARALGGDGKFPIVYGFLRNVRLGGIRVYDVPVYIREFRETKRPIDGYIGLSLISKFITTLDYRNGTLSLEERDKDLVNNVFDDDLAVPLRLTSGGFLSGDVTLPGFDKSLHFIVDTGASVSVVSEQLAATEQMEGRKTRQNINVIGAAGITRNVPIYLLEDIRFGGHSRTGLQAVALSLDLINESSGFQQAGILGGNFLRNYVLTFDFDRSRMVLTPHK